MRTDLVPMSMGDIFDEAFDLYKRNFALFAGVVAVIHIPASMLMSALVLTLDLDSFDNNPSSPEAVSQQLGLMVVFIGVAFIYNLFFILQSGALAIAVSDRHLNHPVTLTSAYRRLVPHSLRLLVTWFLAACLFGAIFLGMALAILFAGAILAAGISGPGPDSQALGIIIGFIMIIVPTVFISGVIVSLGLFLVQIVVVEGGGYVSALQRNWMLIKGRFWSSLGFSFMLIILTYSLTFALAGSIELGLDLAVFSWLQTSSLTQRIVQAVIQNTIGLFVQPFIMICITLLYYDRRVRREGFDLSLLARHLETRRTSELPS
jgi:hypothetical protein